MFNKYILQALQKLIVMICADIDFRVSRVFFPATLDILYVYTVKSHRSSTEPVEHKTCFRLDCH